MDINVCLLHLNLDFLFKMYKILLLKVKYDGNMLLLKWNIKVRVLGIKLFGLLHVPHSCISVWQIKHGVSSDVRVLLVRVEIGI